MLTPLEERAHGLFGGVEDAGYSRHVQVFEIVQRQRLTLAVSQTLKAHAQILQRTGQLSHDAVLPIDAADAPKPTQQPS